HRHRAIARHLPGSTQRSRRHFRGNTMSIAPTPYLTAGYAPELELQISKTRPGMAHFADTGPCGTTCGECAHFGYLRQPRNRTGTRAGCAEFHRLTDKHGPVIADTTPSCRYFQHKAAP